MGAGRMRLFGQFLAAWALLLLCHAVEEDDGGPVSLLNGVVGFTDGAASVQSREKSHIGESSGGAMDTYLSKANALMQAAQEKKEKFLAKENENQQKLHASGAARAARLKADKERKENAEKQAAESRVKVHAAMESGNTTSLSTTELEALRKVKK